MKVRETLLDIPPGEPRPVQDEEPDQRFLERFIPDELIAVGGMGELRRYHDVALERDVVIKVIRPDRRNSEQTRRRFLREARIQAHLQHPCVVPVYDIGNIRREDIYFAMAHIGGMTLGDVIAGLRAGLPSTVKRFSRRQLLEAFCRVCLAIAYAHERGVLHRDLKPENIMLGEYGEVFVLDWGVAKHEAPGNKRSSPLPGSEVSRVPRVNIDDDEDRELTGAGAAVGTLEYMAPEQYEGSLRSDHRSDIFSLGAILYEILSLEPFRSAPTRADLVRMLWIETGEPRERATPPGISPGLDAVWRTATASRPDDRYRTAREMHDAIVVQLDAERASRRPAASSPAGIESSAPVEAAAPVAVAAPVETAAPPANAREQALRELDAARRSMALRAAALSAGFFACWLVFLFIAWTSMDAVSSAAMGLFGGAALALAAYNAWLWRSHDAGLDAARPSPLAAGARM